MAGQSNTLAARHIQNMSEAKILEPHWGYVDRALPCTNDAGSCQYLDVVYHSHDLGMLYAGIIWATIGAILFLCAFGRQIFKRSGYSSTIVLEKEIDISSQPRSSIKRTQQALTAAARRRLLPESVRSIFGRTTRLQVLILLILVGYLTIWSFVGIVYKIWITPVKNSTLHNTRTSLGPWSDRIGILAYALIPLSVLLSSRESILSLLTGIPYQHFNFIHRWLGYIILVQSMLHTIGWTIIETKLYQPQPKVARAWITQKYMIWGVVAQLLMIFMFVFSLRPVIRLTGYEFFRKVHYIIAMLFIGACWGHWQQLKCFLLPSLLIWFLDRGMRLARTALIHYNFLSDGSMGFKAAQAQITHFPDNRNGDVVRMDFTHAHDAWKIGQHFYLCFPQLSIWQSHPFTPTSLPLRNSGVQQHSYIIRAKSGQTKKLANIAASKPEQITTTPVILTGPYGENITSHLDHNSNIMCIAGGTGITYVLPTLLHLISLPAFPNRSIELIWAIRQKSNTKWIETELAALHTASKSHNIHINVFVTQEDDLTGAAATAAIAVNNTPSSSSSISISSTTKEKHFDPTTTTITAASISSSSSSSSTSTYLHRPNLKNLLSTFTSNTASGPTTIYASGPGTMISDLRSAVAECNSGAKVWKGDERFDVRLVCDDRIEW